MLLALDTATHTISLALLADDAILAETTWRTTDTHTIELSPALDDMLRRAGVTSADLRAVAVALGPGSFTGLRIGLSVAKGLALASEGRIALVGVPTLDIVAAAQPHPTGADLLCAVVQAGRGRVSAGFYTWQADRWQSIETPFIATWEALAEHLSEPTLVGGEIDPAGREALAALGERVIVSDAAHALRRAGFLAQIAQERLAAGQTDDPATLAPIYLH